MEARWTTCAARGNGTELILWMEARRITCAACGNGTELIIRMEARRITCAARGNGTELIIWMEVKADKLRRLWRWYGINYNGRGMADNLREPL
jgi:hypothetical protein